MDEKIIYLKKIAKELSLMNAIKLRENGWHKKDIQFTEFEKEEIK